MATKKKKSAVEAFIALPDSEKDRIAKKFDREFSIEKTQPLSASERRQWSKMRREDRKMRGRPRVGLGAQRVPVSAKTGEGMDELRAALRAFLLAQKSDLSDDLILTSARQHEAIERAATSLGAACDALAVPVLDDCRCRERIQRAAHHEPLCQRCHADVVADRQSDRICVGPHWNTPGLRSGS